MRIRKIELTNFKRFTRLTLQDIPESAKLVLLIGSNGSGKSSLFDAFDWLSKGPVKPLPYRKRSAEEYYRKDKLNPSIGSFEFFDLEQIIKSDWEILSGDITPIAKFFGRSSSRIVPRISQSQDVEAIETDADSPVTFIEGDNRFLNDVAYYIQSINDAIRGPVFQGINVDVVGIFRSFIEPLNLSLERIFGTDSTTSIRLDSFQDATPENPPRLIFRKGEAKINYAFLSHGEKQVIILLLNFIARREKYLNSILFIDEMDVHLNTRLQYNLLKEITENWIPEDSQLWTASHALGFIEYANDSADAIILDFDDLDFDKPQVISPSTKNPQVYEVAIPKESIKSIFGMFRLVAVENQNDEFLNAALGQDGYLFLPANNSNQVFLMTKSDEGLLGIRDKDFLREDEVGTLKAKLPRLKILPYYCFENLLYHPDNLEEVNLEGFDKEQYKEEILRQKKENLIQIVSKIGTSRARYSEFKDLVKNDEKIEGIVNALQSDEFDTYYPFFSMKDQFNKAWLNQFKYSKIDLAKTNWLRNKIKETLTT